MDRLTLLFLFSVAFLGHAQDGSDPCKLFGKTLVCSGYIPSKADLADAVDTLIVSKLPEGTYLSLGSPSEAYISATLQKIEIQRSSIVKVDPGYFASLTSPDMLKKLMLRGVNGNINVDKAMLQGLEKSLLQLTVESKINVDLEAISKLSALRELELVFVQVSGDPASLGKILPNLRSLTISETKLKTLPWAQIAEWVKNDKTRILKISDNEWTCDCSTADLKELKPSVSQQALKNLVCAAPANLKGRKFGDISKEELCPVQPPVVDEVQENQTTPKVDVNLGGSGGSGADKDDTKMTVIITCVIVGLLVLAFIIYIIVYRARLARAKRRERGTVHKNKKYISVVETDGLVNSNNQYTNGLNRGSAV